MYNGISMRNSREMMENEEFVKFLKSTLIKIENAINLMNQSKHIPAYNKMLGVQQKLIDLNKVHRTQMLSQLITTRSIINCFINGRYEICDTQILKLKQELINICFKEENNERDKNK